MTAEPPSGRVPDAAQSDPIFATLERYSGVDQDAEEGMRRYTVLTAEHADCSNLSHAEASRIVEEAREQRERAERLALVVAEYRASLADFLEQSQGEHMFPSLVLAAMRDRWVASLSKLDPDQRGAEILKSVETIRQERDAAREALARSAAREHQADLLTARRVDQLERIERIVDRWRLMTPEQLFERIMVVLRGEQPTRPDEPKGEG